MRSSKTGKQLMESSFARKILSSTNFQNVHFRKKGFDNSKFHILWTQLNFQFNLLSDMFWLQESQPLFVKGIIEAVYVHICT